MDRYYYTLSSLPMLRLEMEKPLPLEELLRVARTELGERDYAILLSATIHALESQEPADGTLKRWWNWERTLRNELVRLRAPRKGLDAERYVRPADWQVGPAEIAREALSQDTPLAAEDLLDRARWSFLGELEAAHFFDLGRLIVYYLRLQILHRRAAFNREAGSARFQSVYMKMTEEIAAVVRPQ